ncbi:MAG: acyl carrier protein [Bacteroidetes bacterium GWC2_33_15]|nr:MAG: acyl carrier protein [Bacteroidetes bacterium GWA2_33_15]OFX48731.1 MAG: acyl carrier protein [Bacteroidetes bacterium GWC2_33_15]OFX65973.1 MAG: acyl carrier protein [Bacteroidetes bacterium GWB2_32_14]OFX68266.1 MAG: acyl carrier protein [Bacteroidetes bacterium GWD2_33_33]HAN18047.1 acyl carrier protein [Bacteroidales bacterium]
MEKQEIITKVNDFLIEEFELEESQLVPSAGLKDTLEIDSLDYVDLVVIIEKNFGFKVKGEDFAYIKTLQDFYDYIIKHAKSN